MAFTTFALELHCEHNGATKVAVMTKSSQSVTAMHTSLCGALHSAPATFSNIGCDMSHETNGVTYGTKYLQERLGGKEGVKKYSELTYE